MDSEKNILEPLDIANELHKGLNWVYRHIKSGEIPIVHVGDRYFISRKAFDEWLSGNQTSKSECKQAERAAC